MRRVLKMKSSLINDTLITVDLISPPTKFNSMDTNDTQYFTPDLAPIETSLLEESCRRMPSNDIVLENVKKWMGGMDGGCHTQDICMKAKTVVCNILGSISMEIMMNPELISSYFSEELTASSISVYLRYYSAFTLCLHQSHKSVFPLPVYSNIQNRLERAYRPQGF